MVLSLEWLVTKLKYALDRILAYLFFAVLIVILVGFLALCYALETFRWTW